MKLYSQAFLPSVLSYEIGGKEGLDEATGDHHGRTVMCKLV